MLQHTADDFCMKLKLNLHIYPFKKKLAKRKLCPFGNVSKSHLTYCLERYRIQVLLVMLCLGRTGTLCCWNSAPAFLLEAFKTSLRYSEAFLPLKVEGPDKPPSCLHINSS